MLYIRKTLFFFIICFPVWLFGQNSMEFASPLKIPIHLAGVFGECRPTHFHAGMDIRTNQVSGLPVLAISDGYISRIKISATGYGKAIYITHADSMVSVYGHLSSLQSDVSDFVKSKQEEAQVFEIDLQVPEGLFPVKKGSEIGLSGNSGSSGGPHLHFEVRDKHENIINPLLFNFKTIDTKSPVFTSIAVYDQSINRFNSVPRIIQVDSKSSTVSKYKLISDTVVVNSPLVSIAVSAFDQMENSTGQLALYKLSMQLDNKKQFEFVMDTFSFEESKKVFAYIDQYLLDKYSKKYQRCYCIPDGNIQTISCNESKGIIDLSDNKVHSVVISAEDIHKNNGELRFYIQYKTGGTGFERVILPSKISAYPNSPLRFSFGNIQIDAESGSFYDTTNIIYKRETVIQKGYITPSLFFGRSYERTLKPFSVSFRLNNLPTSQKEKVVCVRKSNGVPVAFQSQWKDSVLTCSGYEMGEFSVMIDTMPPKIVVLTALSTKENMKGSRISFKVTDNLSGLAKYNGFIDGQWKVFEHDAKTGTIFYNLDIPKEQKLHDLVLKVEDFRQNKSEVRLTFKY